ncbi:MAG: hypothetical protein IKT70_06510 [Clostridia bacterium]|nr:hypothetical protein [Clostridia bacterium]
MNCQGLRLPRITASSTDGRIKELESYMYGLVEQLNLALESLDGNIESGYSGNLQAAVTSNVKTDDSQASFNNIKALIIKSADIVNAYYEEMKKKFSGEYVATSDFGTYKEVTASELTASSDLVSQLYSNLQTVISDIKNIESTMLHVNAYINSGLLDYSENGAPIYGLEIGQRTEADGHEVFNKFARFMPDRLSFYDGSGREVAYIGDYKLYITDGEITGNFKLGRYSLILSDGIVFKWI